MSNPGRHNQAGVLAQNWAALSLFMQYLKESEFDYILLEGKRCEDFDLVFNDGHKIVCESKARRRAFSFADLKRTIESILVKRELNENDQVLIICTNLDEQLASSIEHLRYYPKPFIRQFREKGFTKRLISYLPLVRFWKVPLEYNEGLIYALFYDLINIWLPKQSVQQIVNDILVSHIIKKSARGEKYSKKEFREALNGLVQRTIKDSGLLDRERCNSEMVLADVSRAIDDPKDPMWAPNNRASLCAQPNLLFYVLDKIKLNEHENLRKWDKLWELNNVMSIKIFKIFAKHLDTPENRSYVIEYIKRNIGTLRGYYRIDFFLTDVVKILHKVLDQDDSLSKTIFEIVQELFSVHASDNFFFSRHRDFSYERDEISALLGKIYEKSDSDLKSEICKYIINTFNLIEEVGDSDIHTSNVLYGVVVRHITSYLDCTDLEERFADLVADLSKQYSSYYDKYKVKYKGWEIMGSTGAFWGHEYSVSDKKFVETILEPLINKYYDLNSEKAWMFLNTTCISPEKKVSAKRPDFLNRVSIPILLTRFISNDQNKSDEAFKVLQEFILSRKGIPHKSELIYQALKRDDYSPKQKWRLVRVSLDKYKIPVNAFVEQITTELACKGHPEAKKKLLEWIGMPDYFRVHRILINVTQNIAAILESDPKYALKMFKKFVNTAYFRKKYDAYDVYDVSKLLHTFLKRDDCYSEALSILNSLSSRRSLTHNQQILMCYGFAGETTNEIKEDDKYDTRVYDGFIRPYLENTGEVDKHIKEPIAREAFLRFADELSKHKKPELIRKALFIIERFINDPDPVTITVAENASEHNEHQQIINGKITSTIRTVRGRCGWSLMNCAIPAGREYFQKIINLTEVLLGDDNWYVKHMATFALAQLARNRLAITEKGSEEMLFHPKKEEALQMAKKVELLAFNLLDEIVKASPNVQKAMIRGVLQPIQHVRALNQHDAKILLETILMLPDEVVAEADVLFIFFAEFRKGMYDQCAWASTGYYDDLAEFDAEWFKKTLNLLLTDEKYLQTRRKLCWRLWVMPKEYKEDTEKYDKCLKLSLHYLAKAIEVYDPSVYEDVYRFVNDNKDNGEISEGCYDLWRSCLEKEKPYFEEHKDSVSEMYFLPDYNNGDVLLELYKRKRYDEFLKWFKHLSGYPIGFNIGNIESAAKQLVEITDDAYAEGIENIFKNLIDRQPSFYDLKLQWLQKRNETSKQG